MKVSVIIPTYNYANYIFDALNSIESQTYPQEFIEVIVIDDGSTDETPFLIKNYHGPLNLIYHYQENKGKAAATQKGIDLSNGEILFNLDADDYFELNKIEQIVSIYKNYPNVNYVAHPANLVKDGINIGKEKIPTTILNQVLTGEEIIKVYLENRLLFGGGSTFSARTNSLKKQKLPLAVNMYIDECLIYEAAIGHKVYLSNNALSVWRIHNKNYSIQHKINDIIKGLASISASNAMIDYVGNCTKNQLILNLYTLKHWDRYLNFKEKFEHKTLKDYFIILSIIFSNKYSFKLILKYRIIYRLLPFSVIKFIKRFKN